MKLIHRFFRWRQAYGPDAIHFFDLDPTAHAQAVQIVDFLAINIVGPSLEEVMFLIQYFGLSPHIFGIQCESKSTSVAVFCVAQCTKEIDKGVHGGSLCIFSL